MGGKTHMVCGTAVMLAICANPDLYLPTFPDRAGIYAGMTTVCFGSLLPDIDMKGSKLGHKFPIFSKIFTHRGMTHTLVAPVLLWELLHMMPKTNMLNCGIWGLVFGIFIGYCAHILADACNGKGVPVFWPLLTKKVHIPGVDIPMGKAEKLFMLVWCIVCAFVACPDVLTTLTGTLKEIAILC